MAYRVLSGHKHPFFRPEGGAGKGGVFAAVRNGNRKDSTWYTYGWDFAKHICESPEGL